MRDLPTRTPGSDAIDPINGSAEDAADSFVVRHQRGLWRFVHVIGSRGQQAEELCQDAFVIAIDRRQHDRPDPEAAAFLRQTARHLWLKEKRAERRRAKHHAEAAERWWQHEAASDDGSEWLTALGQCVEELPARSRRALDRTYRDGATRAELAREFKLGEHGVRNLLHRLRIVLRDCIRRRRGS